MVNAPHALPLLICSNVPKLCDKSYIQYFQGISRTFLVCRDMRIFQVMCPKKKKEKKTPLSDLAKFVYKISVADFTLCTSFEIMSSVDKTLRP